MSKSHNYPVFKKQVKPSSKSKEKRSTHVQKTKNSLFKIKSNETDETLDIQNPTEVVPQYHSKRKKKPAPQKPELTKANIFSLDLFLYKSILNIKKTTSFKNTKNRSKNYNKIRSTKTKKIQVTAPAGISAPLAWLQNHQINPPAVEGCTGNQKQTAKTEAKDKHKQILENNIV